MCPVTLNAKGVASTQTDWLPEAVPPTTSVSTVIVIGVVVADTVQVGLLAKRLNWVVCVIVPKL